MDEKSPSKNVETVLKNKKIVFAIEGTEEGRSAWQSSLYKAITNLVGQVLLFDPRKQIISVGYQQTQEALFKIIAKEMPDFFMFVPARDSTGFITLDIVRKINHLYPKTKTIAFFGDDDTNFECFSRYVLLFIDYALVVQQNYLQVYDKEGLRSKVFPVHVIHSDLFIPTASEKKQDVVFIGRPTANRIKWLCYLIKKGIRVSIYGYNWADYSEFKEFYGGALSNEELVRIINETKINLSFSRNDAEELHYKGRVFEVAECKSFQLVEYFDGYLNFFKENSEIVMFKDEADLLRKIKYYLKNKEDREKIAERAYERVIKNYDLQIELQDFFKKVIAESSSYRIVPVVKNRIISLNKNILNKSVPEITACIKDAEYISFFDPGDELFEFKNVMQFNSLNKGKKAVGCCGYYVYSESLGNYLLFRSNSGMGDDAFNTVVDASQMMVSREYFLKNVAAFKALYRGNANMINKNDVAFIDLPLYRTKKIKKKARYGVMSQIFKGGCLFLVQLQSLIQRKRIFWDPYLYKLLLIPLFKGNTFVLKHLFASLFDRRYWNRLVKKKRDFSEL